jgi:hypothetical protein
MQSASGLADQPRQPKGRRRCEAADHHRLLAAPQRRDAREPALHVAENEQRGQRHRYRIPQRGPWVDRRADADQRVSAHGSDDVGTTADLREHRRCQSQAGVTVAIQ